MDALLTTPTIAIAAVALAEMLIWATATVAMTTTTRGQDRGGTHDTVRDAAAAADLVVVAVAVAEAVDEQVLPAADAILTIANVEAKAVANGGLMLVSAQVIKSQLVCALTVDGVAEVKVAVTVDLMGKLAETVKSPFVLVVVMMADGVLQVKVRAAIAISLVVALVASLMRQVAPVVVATVAVVVTVQIKAAVAVALTGELAETIKSPLVLVVVMMAVGVLHVKLRAEIAVSLVFVLIATLMRQVATVAVVFPVQVEAAVAVALTGELEATMES